MPRILFADYDFPDVELERQLFEKAGLGLELAQCRTDDEVIRAARGCHAILLQYAPISAAVVSALPELGIVSRIGADGTVRCASPLRTGKGAAGAPDGVGF